jgi:hypothetical protein
MNHTDVTPPEVREDHAQTAIEFADEADSYTDRLQRLYGADRRDSEEIAQVHQRLRTSIKLAEVNALLAIADQVRLLREHLTTATAPVTLFEGEGELKAYGLEAVQAGDPHR